MSWKKYPKSGPVATIEEIEEPLPLNVTLPNEEENFSSEYVENVEYYGVYGIKYYVLGFIWAQYFWDLFLMIRQYITITTVQEVPQSIKGIMPVELFEASRAYDLYKIRFQVIKSLLPVVFTSVTILCGLWVRSWDYTISIVPLEYIEYLESYQIPGEIATSCTWASLVQIALIVIVHLPVEIYSILTIHKLGLDLEEHSLRNWLGLQVKRFFSSVATIVILTPLALLAVEEREGLLWRLVYLQTLLTILTILANFLLLSPPFNDYTPIAEGNLSDDIKVLCEKLKCPLNTVYVIRNSDPASYSRVLTFGIFKATIVLFDSLVSTKYGRGCSNEEILSLIAHEIGHWKYSHAAKDVIALEIYLFFAIVLFCKLFDIEENYTTLGFYDSKPNIIGLVFITRFVMLPYHIVWGWIMTYLSRRYVFQADIYAADHQLAESLYSGLIEMHNNCKVEFPVSDPVFSKFCNVRPTLLERLAVLDTKYIDPRTAASLAELSQLKPPERDLLEGLN